MRMIILLLLIIITITIILWILISTMKQENSYFRCRHIISTITSRRATAASRALADASRACGARARASPRALAMGFWTSLDRIHPRSPHLHLHLSGSHAASPSYAACTHARGVRATCPARACDTFVRRHPLPRILVRTCF